MKRKPRTLTGWVYEPHFKQAQEDEFSPPLQVDVSGGRTLDSDFIKVRVTVLRRRG